MSYENAVLIAIILAIHMEVETFITPRSSNPTPKDSRLFLSASNRWLWISSLWLRVLIELLCRLFGCGTIHLVWILVHYGISYMEKWIGFFSHNWESLPRWYYFSCDYEYFGVLEDFLNRYSVDRYPGQDALPLNKE